MDQLLGTWSLVSHEAVSMYGPDPKGIAFFDAGGRFIISVMRSDRTNYGIGHPGQGTDEENMATAQGTMTYFGTYMVNEADSTIAIHIEASSFPNWSGADQNRTLCDHGRSAHLDRSCIRGPRRHSLAARWIV
jgi:hypothetical protein